MAHTGFLAAGGAVLYSGRRFLKWAYRPLPLWWPHGGQRRHLEYGGIPPASRCSWRRWVLQMQRGYWAESTAWSGRWQSHGTCWRSVGFLLDLIGWGTGLGRALPQDQELRLQSRCCQVWAITSQGRGGDTAVHRRFTSMIHSVRCFQLLSGSLAPYLVFGVFRHSCSAFSLRSTSSCHSAVLTLILVSFWRLHYTGVPLPEPAGWRHIRHT